VVIFGVVGLESAGDIGLDGGLLEKPLGAVVDFLFDIRREWD
jgi:hypothetical protein